VRQLGGLKPLIDLLQSDSPLIRFNAVGAFPLLTELEVNVKDCVELGLIGPLVQILSSDTNVLLLQNAAQTLGNIAEGQLEHQNLIREAQGLKKLCDVMAVWSEQEDDKDAAQLGAQNRQELLAKCCYAVWIICDKNEVNQTAYRDANGLPGLVKLLVPDNEDALLEMAAGAICALCEGSQQNKESFRECQGIQPLIELLEHKTDTVRLNAAKALCHLSENHENRTIIRTLGGLEKLVKLLAT
jgi:HEAT repeat protein